MYGVTVLHVLSMLNVLIAKSNSHIYSSNPFSETERGPTRCGESLHEQRGLRNFSACLACFFHGNETKTRSE